MLGVSAGRAVVSAYVDSVPGSKLSRATDKDLRFAMFCRYAAKPRRELDRVLSSAAEDGRKLRPVVSHVLFFLAAIPAVARRHSNESTLPLDAGLDSARLPLGLQLRRRPRSRFSDLVLVFSSSRFGCGIWDIHHRNYNEHWLLREAPVGLRQKESREPEPGRI